MSWRPKLSWENAQLRAKLISDIRSFFSDKGVLEVETPLMSQGTVTDVHLDAFSTRYDFLADHPDSKAYFLQTSPEFAMKRLLASGYGCIYQICKAFRHEPQGRFHNPEFTMLEWYRVGYDHFQLMDEVSLLLKCVLSCKEPVRLTYQRAFIEYTAIDPLQTDIGQLKAYLLKIDRLDSWLKDEACLDTLLQFIFAEFIEPNIGLEEPCFIYDFPLSQASLAKVSNNDNRVAERFECYFKGIELANGFHELTNASEQKQRFNQDNALRAEKGLSERAIDQRFISALTNGLPDCAGVAIGIDRLVMLALDAKNITDVISFTTDNA